MNEVSQGRWDYSFFALLVKSERRVFKFWSDLVKGVLVLYRLVGVQHCLKFELFGVIW